MLPQKTSNKQIKCNTKKQTSNPNPSSSSQTPYISMMLAVCQVLLSAPYTYTSLNPLNSTKSTVPMRRKLSTAGVTPPRSHVVWESARVWTQAVGLQDLWWNHYITQNMDVSYSRNMYSEGTFICFSFLIIGMEPHFLISAGLQAVVLAEALRHSQP